MASSSTEPAAKRHRDSLDDPEGDFDLGLEQEEQFDQDEQNAADRVGHSEVEGGIETVALQSVGFSESLSGKMPRSS